MLSYKASETMTIPGRGMVKIIQLDRDCNDFNWINGHEVDLNGERLFVRGVEHFTHSPPWRKGETVGLLIGERPAEPGWDANGSEEHQWPA